MTDFPTKDAIDGAIASLAPEVAALSDDLAAHPELSGEEFESSRKIVALLRKGGFDVEYPYLGLPTAFRAVRGKPDGASRVALLVEYDALPEIGHACGHNLHGSMSVLAGLALAPLMERIDGELVLFGTPAEETNGAKVLMADRGAFDGFDLALMIHCHGGATFVPYRSLAMDAVEFVFRGKAAHAAGMPWEGKNALNGVQLLFHAVDMLRQHVRPEVRMHGIVSKGGAAPNIVPETAEARFYFRAPKRAYLDQVLDQVHDCARGAALATGTEVEWRNFEFSFDDVLPNGAAEAMMEEIFSDLAVPLSPSPGALGSSDVGNVSYRCPAIQPEMDFTGRHVAAHTREFAAAVTGPRAHEALVTGARALARAALRVFFDGDLRRRMKEDFEANLSR